MGFPRVILDNLLRAFCGTVSECCFQSVISLIINFFFTPAMSGGDPMAVPGFDKDVLLVVATASPDPCPGVPENGSGC